MRYDPASNNLIDSESGNVIVQFQDNDELPPEYFEMRKDYLYALNLSEATTLSTRSVNTIDDSILDSDRLLALQLAEHEQVQMQQRSAPPPPVSTLARVNAILEGGSLPLGGGPLVGGPVRPHANEGNYEVSSLETAYINMHANQRVSPDDAVRGPSTNRGAADEAFARALQILEFEIIDETAEMRRMNGEGTDFQTKEIRAAGRKRQLFTISTLICLAQIILLIVVCQTEGIAPSSQNPLYGPSAAALVKYGAKNAYLIVRERQWWRLFSAIFMHAGVVHIICNLIVQIQVGGYLNLVYGSFYWFIIYVLSGIFGNMFSCIFLPNTVGVGSSGAVLGMLSSWIVWIVFRWKKVPEAFLKQRNCQLIVLVISTLATLAFSFAPLVDWAAHFGGFIMGILSGLLLLAKELDNKYTMMAVRIISLSCIIGLYAWAIDNINNVLNPADPFKPI